MKRTIAYLLVFLFCVSSVLLRIPAQAEGGVLIETFEKAPLFARFAIGTVKATDVIETAESALISFAENGVFPANVKVGSNEYTQASFFRMMAHVLYYTLAEGKTGDIPVYNNPAPASDAQLADGFTKVPEISKGAYLYAAQRQLAFMDDMEKDGTPSKVVSFPGAYTGTEGYKGQLLYSRMLVIFARALVQYRALGNLPDTVSASFEMTDMPVSTPTVKPAQTPKPIPDTDAITVKPESGYTVDTQNGTLSGLGEKTSLKMFLESVENSENIIVTDFDGVRATDENTLVGTGYIVRLIYGNGIIIDSVTVVVLGDATGDSMINSRDIAVLQKHVTGAQKLRGSFLLAADMRWDEVINSRDIAQLQRMILL